MFITSTLNASAKNFYDFAIVGGGIIGCATARQIKLSRPNMSAVILEKETKLAVHQTGHNSGVLHAGIYYAPGSLKARLCVEGIDLAYKYCDKKSIPYKKCGKLIVAVNNDEILRLENLFHRAQRNNCRDISIINADKIKEIEPYCQGIKAIWSPHTGIVDWSLVTQNMAEDFKQMGGNIELDWKLKDIKESHDPEHPVLLLGENGKECFAKYLITCTGLYSDRIAKLTRQWYTDDTPKIIPFRGEYLKLKEEKRYLVKQANIYPVPDPRFPFLGVHFTPTIYADVLLGPNAVLAFSREGYNKTDFSSKDFLESIKYRGMRKLIFKNVCYGLGEMTRSVYLPAQIKLLQKYIPELTPNDVEPGRAGVRAQALDKDGNLVDDFVFEDGGSRFFARVLHVLNAPSPGATSSLAIAKMIFEKCKEKFYLSD